jgi:hypothetical protein
MQGHKLSNTHLTHPPTHGKGEKREIGVAMAQSGIATSIVHLLPAFGEGWGREWSQLKGYCTKTLEGTEFFLLLTCAPMFCILLSTAIHHKVGYFQI